MPLATSHPQIHKTTTVLTDILPAKIVGIYLYGSAVDGGLKPKSDLDFFVVLSADVSEEEKKQLIQQLLSISGAIDNKEHLRYLEVTLIHQTELTTLDFPLKRIFQYGEWLRDEFIQGYIPENQADPDLAIVLRKVKQNSVALIGPEANQLLPDISTSIFNQAIRMSLPQLIQDIEEDQTNVILTLCRMLYSIQTGNITAKDQAAQYCLAHIPQAFHPLVQEAKQCYLGLQTSNTATDKAALLAFGAYMQQQIESD